MQYQPWLENFLGNWEKKQESEQKLVKQASTNKMAKIKSTLSKINKTIKACNNHIEEEHIKNSLNEACEKIDESISKII